jgi:hypothetical protein
MDLCCSSKRRAVLIVEGLIGFMFGVLVKDTVGLMAIKKRKRFLKYIKENMNVNVL